jgi:uncharacterized membrane protein YeaQ/YmgE (transglycosylase-associated protein family)
MKEFLTAMGSILGVWLIGNLVGAALVGALARWMLPGKDRVGWFTTIVIGFLGGILGKVVAFFFGYHYLGPVGGFVVSVLGAAVLLIAHRIRFMIRNRRTGTPKT